MAAGARPRASVPAAMWIHRSVAIRVSMVGLLSDVGVGPARRGAAEGRPSPRRGDARSRRGLEELPPARLIGLQDEQLALAPHPGEGAPVEGARAPAVERGEVLRGRVTLVAGGGRLPGGPGGPDPHAGAGGPCGERGGGGGGAARGPPPPGLLRGGGGPPTDQGGGCEGGAPG